MLVGLQKSAGVPTRLLRNAVPCTDRPALPRPSQWPPGSAPPAAALPPPPSPPGPNAWGGAPNGRTLEDLKERYYR